MADWNFLLQKEGDRSWLPLDSPDVEILEGRYRIIAKFNQPDAEIEIHISHLATDAVPPVRRAQTRSGKTNSDGLMVMIPFTHLQPGEWELACTASTSVGLPERSSYRPAQRHSLQLHVLVGDCALEDWEPDWSQSAAPTETNALTKSVPISAQPAPTSSFTTASNAPDNAEFNEFLTTSVDRLLQLTEQMSEQLVNELLQNLDLSNLTDAGNSTPQPGAYPTDPSTSPPAPQLDNTKPRAIAPPTANSSPYCLPAGATCTLQLDSETLVAQPETVLTVSGKVLVELAAAAEPSTTAPNQIGEVAIPDPWEAETEPAQSGSDMSLSAVQLTLRDPQTLQVLVREQHPLTGATPPFDFCFRLTLPERLTTHLVLGEVLLYGSSIAIADDLVVVTTQPFTVTTNPGELAQQLARLSQTLANHSEQAGQADLPTHLFTQIAKEDALDVSFLNLTSIKAVDQSQSAEPLGLSFLEQAQPATELRSPAAASQKQLLPPQLYYPAPDQLKDRRLELPSFMKTRSPEPTPEAPLAESEIASPTATTEAAALELAATNPFTKAPDLVQVQPPQLEPDLTDALANVTEEADAVEPDVIGSDVVGSELALSDVLLTPASKSATPANLELPSSTQIEFQSLRSEDRFFNRLSTLASTKQAPTSPGVQAEQSNPFGSVGLDGAMLATTEPDYLSQEIVVDDDSDQVPTPQPEVTLAAENPLVLAPEESVPTPELTIISGELTSGQPVNVRARIPNLLPCIYIKLWITDCATRSLLDGPRWLSDLIPNGHGELEAMTQLTVPFGSLEVRFEAIAVEMATQRESHKISLERAVIPPDLPTLSLDEFKL